MRKVFLLTALFGLLTFTVNAQSWEWYEDLEINSDGESGEGQFTTSNSDDLYFIGFNLQHDDIFDIRIYRNGRTTHTFRYNPDENVMGYTYPGDKDLGSAYTIRSACEKAINYYVNNIDE